MQIKQVSNIKGYDVIGLDIDDTIIDTRKELIGTWKEYVNKYHITEYGEELPTSINAGWDDPIIRNFWDEYRYILCEKGIALEGAVESIQKLREKGKTIKIVTARLAIPDYMVATRNSLEKNNIQYDELIFQTKYKGQACVDNGIHLLIDDSINNIQNTNEFGIDAILYEHGDNWHDVYIKILELDAKKRRF